MALNPCINGILCYLIKMVVIWTVIWLKNVFYFAHFSCVFQAYSFSEILSGKGPAGQISGWAHWWFLCSSH